MIPQPLKTSRFFSLYLSDSKNQTVALNLLMENNKGNILLVNELKSIINLKVFQLAISFNGNHTLKTFIFFRFHKLSFSTGQVN